MDNFLAVLLMTSTNALFYGVFLAEGHPIPYAVIVLATVLISIFVVGAAKVNQALREECIVKEVGRLGD